MKKSRASQSDKKKRPGAKMDCTVLQTKRSKGGAVSYELSCSNITSEAMQSLREDLQRVRLDAGSKRSSPKGKRSASSKAPASKSKRPAAKSKRQASKSKRAR